MPVVNPSDYRKKIQHKVLLLIKKKLQNKEIDANRAKEIAQYVLETLSDKMTNEEMYRYVKEYDKQFPELIEIVFLAVKEHSETLRQIIAREVGKLIAQHDYQKANDLLRKIN